MEKHLKMEVKGLWKTWKENLKKSFNTNQVNKTWKSYENNINPSIDSWLESSSVSLNLKKENPWTKVNVKNITK